MDRFAFIIHPIDPKRDVARKYPLLGKVLNEPAINFLSRFWPPLTLSQVTGARSAATGKQIEGWLIAVPYTPQTMLRLPPAEVYRKIIAAGRLAEKLGANILGLGAYTSVVGDGGVTIANALDIPVTSGDSYTAAVAADALARAAGVMDVDMSAATLAIVGASGAIGAVMAQILGPAVARLLLVGRQVEPLQRVRNKVQQIGCGCVEVITDLSSIKEAELVVTVTSAGGNLVQADMLRTGAVVCDVSRPRDVSRQVSQRRKDVLVIDGGLVRVPGEVNFGFDYGTPPDLTYGCIAETMTLAFEGLFTDYTVGRELTLDQVRQITTMATNHGFTLGALRSFERKLDDSIVQQIKANARAGGIG